MAQDLVGTEGSLSLKVNGDEAAIIRQALKLYIQSKNRAVNGADDDQLKAVFQSQYRAASDLSRKFGG